MEGERLKKNFSQGKILSPKKVLVIFEISYFTNRIIFLILLEKNHHTDTLLHGTLRHNSFTVLWPN